MADNTSAKGGLIISSGSTSPTTESPSAPSGGPINLGGSISSGAAPTMGVDLVSPQDQADMIAGPNAVGDITQDNTGQTAATQDATQPPYADKVNPETGQGQVNKTPPGTGGTSSPAHPVAGKGKAL
jgi:hypothetical protein